jgi:1-acyl-sn-glycerol-3-phosphate acyltransferase
MTIFTHFFFWPRYILCWVINIVFMGIAIIVMIGQDKSKKTTPYRYWYIRASCFIGARVILFIYGFVSVKKIETLVNYKAFLGPDWDPKKAKFQGAGTIVINHQSTADILCQLYLTRPPPSFLAKIETLDLPGINYYCKEIDCLYVKREANDSKHKLLGLIKERQ